ncbi:MAG: LPS export ABC transporter permease LptF [Candidatus Binatia bacterium]
MGKILHRYIFREIWTPFLLGLSVFTFVLLIARLLKLIELVVNRGLPAPLILRLFIYILPGFLEVTVPMAMLLAILVAFGRLSADSEITAMRSSGLSLYQLLPAVATFAMLSTTATALLSLHARPWGNRWLKAVMYDIATTRASAGLKAQVFNDDFPGLVIYTDRVDSTSDHLEHVLISDERDPNQHNTIFAHEGFMISDRETQTVTLRLIDGRMHTAENGAEYQTDFQSYDVNLDLRQELADRRKKDRDAKELTLGELRRAIKARRAAGQPFGSLLVEYHRKFSIPAACLVFALVGMPLGIQPARAVKSRGFALSLTLIFLYYVFLSTGQAMAERSMVPAFIGLWLPNVVFAAIGLYLFRQAARERPIVALDRIGQVAGRAQERVLAWLGVERHS